MDAEAVRFSIERRRKVDAGPAYMVAPIVETSAPDPLTLVVDLKTPINPFTSWLASPYGLKVVNPKLVNENEKDGDSAQEWMATHCAGTGPYDLTSVTKGQRYELATNKHYWGTKPEFSKVDAQADPELLDPGAPATVRRPRHDDPRPHEGRRRSASSRTTASRCTAGRASRRSTCGSTRTSRT